VRTLVVLVIAAAACGKGSAKTQPQAKKDAGTALAVGDAGAAAMAGQRLFVALCSQCHGADAKGYKADHAPSLVNPTFLASASDAFIHRGIAVGRPGTSMAAYGKLSGGPLDDAAIDQMVAWLRSQGPEPSPLAPVGPGDVTRGQVVYAASCQKCHGDAMTRGEGVHLANPRFQELATEPFLRYAIVNGRPGTPMEAFAKKLSDQQIDDVVAYVKTLGQGPAPSAELPPPTGKEPLVINPDGKDPKFELRAETGQPARFVSVDQVKQALEQKRRIVIVDARPASDWMKVHITGAVSIPYMDMKRLDELPKDGSVWVVAYCACPHHLSGIVVDELRKRGYEKSAVLDEGILEWHRRGYPVVAAYGVMPPPKELPPPAPGVIP
jgi:cytochrome c oxidase cbb3-type subunit 3